jgi:hypothetical protein
MRSFLGMNSVVSHAVAVVLVGAAVVFGSLCPAFGAERQESTGELLGCPERLVRAVGDAPIAVPTGVAS